MVDIGFPNLTEMVNLFADPDFEGMKPGTIVGAVQFEQDQEGPSSAHDIKAEPHLSYPVIIRGKGLGYFSNPIHVLKAIKTDKVGNAARRSAEVRMPDAATFSITEARSEGLQAAHNISIEKLRFAEDLGGLPAPSIGLVRMGQTLDGFGDITLLGTEDLVGGGRANIYESDAWTPRMPPIIYKKPTYKAAAEFADPMRSVFREFGDKAYLSEMIHAISAMGDRPGVARKLEYVDGAKAYYLKIKHGLEIAPKRLSKAEWERVMPVARRFANDPQFLRDIDKIEALSKFPGSPEEEQVMIAAIDAAIERRVDGMAIEDPGARRDMVELMRSNVVGKTGEQERVKRFWVRDKLAPAVAEMKHSPGKPRPIDRVKTRASLNWHMRGKESDFLAWIDGKLNDLFPGGGEMELRGKRVPYTLENVLSAMTGRKQRAMEKSWAFGPGKVRASASRKFKTVEDARQQIDRLLSQEEFAEFVQNTQSPAIDAYQEKLRESHPDMGWDELDNSMKVLSDYLRGTSIENALRKNGFTNVSDDVASLAKKTALMLREAPTEYFEAKVQDVVRLSEFQAAVAPKQQRKSVEPLAKKYGWKVEYYGSEIGAKKKAMSAISRKAPGTTFSLVGRDDPLIKAIEAKLAKDLTKAEFAENMVKRIHRVRDRYEHARWKKNIEAGSSESIRMNLLADLAILAAIQSTLPVEIRNKVGTFDSLAQFRTQAGREKELVRRVSKLDSALTGYLLNDYKKKVGKLLKRSLGNKRQNKTRRGNIGVAAHAFAVQAEAAMAMTADEATTKAVELENEFWATRGTLQGDQLEREIWKLDARKRALDLFYDWAARDALDPNGVPVIDPDTGRVVQTGGVSLTRAREAYEQLDEEYTVGRQKWITTLMERKAQRQRRVAKALELMGAPDEVVRGQRVPERARGAEQKRSRKISSRVNEMLLGWFGGMHHKLARIVENAKDKDKAREFYYEMLDGRIQAEVRSQSEQAENQDALFAKIAEVIGAKGTLKGHKIRQFLFEAKQLHDSNITLVEGQGTSKLEIPKDLVEGILDGTYTGAVAQNLSDADMAQLEKAWDEYQQLSDKQQAQRQVIRFERFSAKGGRRSLGKITQGDALQLWLTMRQPDQAEKLEAMGYDSDTMVELEAFLKPEMKQLGLWMVDQLKKEGDAINSIHEAEYGISMARPKNYFRVRNEIHGKEVELNQETAGVQAGVTPGALKERQSNRARPDRVNAFANYLAHTTEMAYWKHNVQWVREWGGVIKDVRFAEAMKAYVSKKAYQELALYLQTVENHGSVQANAIMEFERFVKTLMRRFSMSILGARMSTIWINMTAAFNTLGTDIPVHKILRNFFTMWVNRKGALKATWQNDLNRLRRRFGASFEAAMAMAENDTSRPIVQSLEKAAQYGMMPMNYADVGSNSLTLAAVYQTVLQERVKEGMSEADARAEADATVTRAVATLAQPTLNVSKSRAEVEAPVKPLYIFLTLFLSEMRKNFANNYVAWRTVMTGRGTVSRATAARQAAFWTMFYPAMSVAMREIFNAFTDDESDEEYFERTMDPKYWTYAVMTEQIRAIPVLGETGTALLGEGLEQKYYEGRNPITGAFQKVINAGKGEDLSPAERTEKLLKSMVGVGTALPGAAVLAEGANVAQFGMEFWANKDLPKLEALERVAPLKQAEAARERIYEDTEDNKERWELLAEEYRKIKKDNPGQWPRIEEMLKEKKILPKAVQDKL